MRTEQTILIKWKTWYETQLLDGGNNEDQLRSDFGVFLQAHFSDQATLRLHF